MYPPTTEYQQNIHTQHAFTYITNHIPVTSTRSTFLFVLNGHMHNPTDYGTHKHTRTHTHTRAHTNTNTHNTNTNTHSHTHSLTHTLSLSHTHTPRPELIHKYIFQFA